MGGAPTRIGVLETGFPPPPLAERFGSFADMVAEMLGDGFACTAFDVTRGQYPKAGETFDGYVVTGSSASVYDPLPWIAPLEAFLRAVRGRARLVGLCFGHQIMAQAFGGRVERSEKGYAQGLHCYALATPVSQIGDAATIAIPVSHGDQVTEPPDGVQVLGGSAFTPLGVLAYGSDGLSFQCHPEFSPEFAAALIERRAAKDGGTAEAETLIATLAEPNDRAAVAAWIGAFLRD